MARDHGSGDRGADASASRVICAWCKALLDPGPAPASHGVCPRCLKKELNLALSDLSRRVPRLRD